MSRSVKKPYYTDSNIGAKRYANKVVRRYKGVLANGKAYKKVYCSYNITDWIMFCPEDVRAYRK
jgi:hypothetical protein